MAVSVQAPQWRRRMKFKFPALLPSPDVIQNRIDFVSTDLIYQVDVSGNIAVDDSTFAPFLQTLWPDRACESIDLSGTSAGPICARNLAVLSATCLKNLRLRDLKISAQETSEFASQFVEGSNASDPIVSTLETLDIGGNHSSMLNMLPVCVNLRTLDLSGVKLHGDFPQARLTLLGQLENLIVQRCELSVETLACIANLGTLRSLDFSLNDLAHITPDIIVSVLKLPLLHKINCGNCALSSAVTHAILPALGDRTVEGDVEGRSTGLPIPTNSILPEDLEQLIERRLASGSSRAARDLPQAVPGSNRLVQVTISAQEYEEFKLWKANKDRRGGIPAPSWATPSYQAGRSSAHS